MEAKYKIATEVTQEIADMFQVLMDKSKMNKTDLIKKLIVDKFNDLNKGE